MSYSRWSNSTWYTFWTSWGPDSTFKLPTKKLKDSQCFEICDFPSYIVTYGELKANFKGKVKEIERFYSQPHTTPNWRSPWNPDMEPQEIVWTAKNPTFEEMCELRRYLLEFISDVDEHFKWNKFFLFEWYYPIRNKIFWKVRKIKQNVFRTTKVRI